MFLVIVNGIIDLIIVNDFTILPLTLCSKRRYLIEAITDRELDNGDGGIMKLNKEYYIKKSIIRILIFITWIIILFVLSLKVEYILIQEPIIVERTVEKVYAMPLLQDDEFGDAVLKEINKKREYYGKELLKRNAVLDISATQKAQEIIKKGIFSHSWSGRRSFSDEIYDANYPNKKNNVFGENLACGYSESEDVVEGWMSSLGHRKNLLKAGFRDMGVGVGILKEDGAEKCFLIVLHLGGTI